MKKLLIGGLVAGLILFIWQFLSWGLLNLHGSHMSYTPNQDKVLSALAENLEPGNYFVPRAPDGSSEAEMQTYTEKYTGKPWAMVQYHPTFEVNMASNMIRGFAIDFVIGLLLCWILMQFKDLTFMHSLMACVSIGLIGYLAISYLNSIWFQTDTLADLLDAVVTFGLIGAFLGWWLNR